VSPSAGLLLFVFRECVRVRVCVCVRARARTHAHACLLTRTSLPPLRSFQVDRNTFPTSSVPTPNPPGAFCLFLSLSVCVCVCLFVFWRGQSLIFLPTSHLSPYSRSKDTGTSPYTLLSVFFFSQRKMEVYVGNSPYTFLFSLFFLFLSAENGGICGHFSSRTPHRWFPAGVCVCVYEYLVCVCLCEYEHVYVFLPCFSRTSLSISVSVFV